MTATQNKRANVGVWFEIPVTDMERALTYYRAVLDVKLEREVFAGTEMAVFPFEGNAATGALMMCDRKPSLDGSVIYLNCDGKLDAVMARVEAHGGRLLGPKITLPDNMGAFFLMQDSEGNQVGCHAD